MKNLKRKVVSLVLAVSMVFSIIAMPVAAATTTTQTPAEFLQSKGLLQGDENGNLMLDQDLTREQMMVILSRLMGEEEIAKTYSIDSLVFTDVPATSEYANYIAWAYDAGYTQGTSETTFGFGAKLTQWQTAAFFVRALGFIETADEDILAKAEELGLTADVNVDESANALREVVAQIMYNTIYATNVDGDVLGEVLGVVEPAIPTTLADVKAATTATTASTVAITGKVTPATAKVTVAGEAATVAADGTFTATATLVDGANNIEVVAGTAKQTLAVSKVSISVTAKNADAQAVALAGATNMVADKDNLFTITFPYEVNKDTVTRTYIKLYEGTGLVALSAPTVKADSKTITIGPADNLKDNTSYKLVILPGIKKVDGTDALTANVEAAYTTGAANYVTSLSDGLSQTSTVNVASVAYGDDFQFTFKRDLDPSSISAASVKLYDITGGTNTLVPVVNKLGGSNTILRSDIAATDGLTTGHQYKFVFGTLKDLLGVNVALGEVYFTVGSTQITATIYQADRTTALASAKIWPKLIAGSLDGTTAIKNGVKFYVGFNQTQALDVATITSNTIYVEKLDKNNAVVGKVAATVNYDSTYRMAEIVPSADLDADTDYKLTIKRGENGVKDILGLTLAGGTSDQTVSFDTFDTTAPVVSTVQLKTGSANDVTITSGTIDVDSSKQLRFAFNFNEEIAGVDNDGTYTAAKYDTTLVGGNAKFFAAGKSVILVNTTDDTAVNIATTVSLSSDYKTLYVTLPADTLEKAHSYAIKLAGKSGNPVNSVVDAHAIADRTNFDGSNANGVNRMAEMYQVTFSTKDTDSDAPTVKEIRIGSTYADSTVLTAATKNVDAAKNLYVVFSEKMNDAAAKTTADADGNNTLASDNVQLQYKDSVQTTWAAAALTNSASGGDYVRFTYDATKEVSYLTISKDDIGIDKNYKLVITPGADANGLEDISLNDMSNDFFFEFTTDGTLAFTPVTAGTNTTANIGTLAAATAAGTKTLSVTGNDAFTSGVGEYVGIEVVDGSMIFDTVATLNSAEPATTTNNLTSAADSGAMIVDFTNASASFSDMSTGYKVSDPIAIRIDGASTDKVDLNTITTSTVKIVKASDNSAVAADVTAVRGAAGDALVSINPTSDLAYDTQYKLVVEGVKSELNNTVVTKSAYFTTELGSPEKIAIVSVTPANGSTGIAVNGELKVVFNADMTAGSGAITGRVGGALVKGQTTAVGTNVLAVADPAAGTTVALKDLTDNAFITGRLALSSDGKTLTILPDALLAPDHLYSIILGGGLSTNDISSGADTILNNVIGAVKVYTFRTEVNASTTPQITSARYIDVNDSKTVNTGDIVIITFNTAIDDTTFTSEVISSELSIDMGGNIGDAVAAWSTDKKTVTLTLADDVTLVPSAAKVNPILNAFKSATGVNVDSSISVTITK